MGKETLYTNSTRPPDLFEGVGGMANVHRGSQVCGGVHLASKKDYIIYECCLNYFLLSDVLRFYKIFLL